MMHLENISMTDTLLDLGGDSLTAITLSTKILSKFNVQIYVKNILTENNLMQISDLIKKYMDNNNTRSHLLRISTHYQPHRKEFIIILK